MQPLRTQSCKYAVMHLSIYSPRFSKRRVNISAECKDVLCKLRYLTNDSFSLYQLPWLQGKITQKK